ncbi:MAG: flagellar motor protein MotA [Alphaproteobacteria bacterium]|jgi:hypothetical protein|nr:flagellar motor protein MotA [Alphaproteobacteria bacterium]MBT4084474.1 flagellar motor protein MotA [Alphaproteobacteria bacterium]MBT4545719.1 flagellar motor protein MotA [Alphaproteobacteria bacterium]MBT7744322.1 flagellar motor protein MotA [Alphaproteobacteria bacterium]
MTRPQRFLTRMAIFLVVVIIIAGFLAGPMHRAFLANPALNGLIVGVLVLGIIYVFRQVLLLRPEVDWIEMTSRDGPRLSIPVTPTLLAPMATMLGDTAGQRSISALGMRSLLDGIASRLDESREISRYLIGLLIFLGLLGTFWGLLGTIGAVGNTIKNLSVEGGDFAVLFASLKAGLEAPLVGMSTAFSSSLFGLAGSLVLGFLDLQAGQAQNRFFNDLEEWLSTKASLGSGASIGDGDQSVPAYVSALLEQTAESLTSLQRSLIRGEEDRSQTTEAIQDLGEKLAVLGDQMKAGQDLMIRLGEAQLEMKPVLERLASATERESTMTLDEVSRGHLRNIDVYAGRLLKDSAPGRDMMVEEMRSEIKLLARTIAGLAKES